MSKFWKREEPLERELRTSFEAPAGFEEALGERVKQSAPAARYARASHRLFVTALVVFMLGTFASFGGVSLAAQGARQTVSAVAHVTVAPKRVVHRTTAASDQYGKTAAVVKAVKVVTKAKPKAKPKPAAAVLAATTTKKGTLPFTGISLLATVLLSLVFVSAGLILRRLGSRAPRSL
jgi:hypothetical protein